jgi:hypothetical protein
VCRRGIFQSFRRSQAPDGWPRHSRHVETCAEWHARGNESAIVDDVKLPSAARAIRAYATLRKKADEEDRRAARAALGSTGDARRAARRDRSAVAWSCRGSRKLASQPRCASRRWPRRGPVGQRDVSGCAPWISAAIDNERASPARTPCPTRRQAHQAGRVRSQMQPRRLPLCRGVSTRDSPPHASVPLCTHDVRRVVPSCRRLPRAVTNQLPARLYGIGNRISAISAAKRGSLRIALNGGCTRIHGRNAWAGRWASHLKASS